MATAPELLKLLCLGGGRLQKETGHEQQVLLTHGEKQQPRHPWQAEVTAIQKFRNPGQSSSIPLRRTRGSRIHLKHTSFMKHFTDQENTDVRDVPSNLQHQVKARG